MSPLIRAARLEDAPGIARVHVDSWRTTYAGLVPADYLADLSYEKMEARRIQGLSNPHVRTLVAETEDGRVVGFATGGPERSGDPEFRGELYAIYLLAEQQGRGLGRRLVERFAGELAELGFDSMLVWVLAENPARRFYAAMGGEPVREQIITIGGARLPEIGFGWRSLGPLLQRRG